MDFFMPVLAHVSAERSVFRANISEHCNFVSSTARARPKEICQVIIEGLVHPRNLSGFASNDNSPVGCLSGTKSDDNASSVANGPSSKRGLDVDHQIPLISFMNPLGGTIASLSAFWILPPAFHLFTAHFSFS